LSDDIVAKVRALGLVEIASVLIKPIAQGSYQDAVDNIQRRQTVWASVRAAWTDIAEGRGLPVRDVADALVIEINTHTTEDILWFGQHQDDIVRAVRALGMEHISKLLLRPFAK
jgi:hypothetical protein